MTNKVTVKTEYVEPKRTVTLELDEDTAYAVMALVGHHCSSGSEVSTYDLFSDLKDRLGQEQRYEVAASDMSRTSLKRKGA